MGTQRSGTTLLRLILDSHPNIAIGFETGFMRAADVIKNIPNWKYGKRWYRRYGIDEAEMNERIRRFYTEIFEQYAARQGKQRWGEKTPLNLHHMAQMMRIFPDAQFVCIVRHAGAVAASLARWDYSFDDAIDYWIKANRRFRRHGPQLGPERFHLCRYEDLVLHAEPTLRGVVRFLGEPWSDDLLRHHQVQLAKGGDTRVEGGTQLARPLEDVAVDRWRDELAERDLQALAERPAPLLRYFGYEPATAVPVGSLAVSHANGERDTRPRA